MKLKPGTEIIIFRLNFNNTLRVELPLATKDWQVVTSYKEAGVIFKVAGIRDHLLVCHGDYAPSNKFFRRLYGIE